MISRVMACLNAMSAACSAGTATSWASRAASRNVHISSMGRSTSCARSSGSKRTPMTAAWRRMSRCGAPNCATRARTLPRMLSGKPNIALFTNSSAKNGFPSAKAQTRSTSASVVAAAVHRCATSSRIAASLSGLTETTAMPSLRTAQTPGTARYRARCRRTVRRQRLSGAWHPPLAERRGPASTRETRA
jgi:hypothetical protein